MADEKIIEKVREFLKYLVSEGIVITKAYLYGSQARGEANENSDIDLLLVSPLFDNHKLQYARTIWFAPSRIQNRIEPFLVGEKRFQEDQFSPVIAAVRSEGIEVSL